MGAVPPCICPRQACAMYGCNTEGGPLVPIGPVWPAAVHCCCCGGSSSGLLKPRPDVCLCGAPQLRTFVVLFPASLSHLLKPPAEPRSNSVITRIDRARSAACPAFSLHFLSPSTPPNPAERARSLETMAGTTVQRAALLLLVLGMAAGAMAQSAAAPHGAYLGCFDLAKLDGVRDADNPARFAAYSVNKCAGYCRAKGSALNAISATFACHCLNVIPGEAARLAEASCGDKGAGVALFYNHAAVAESSCRVANVPMEKSSFSFHYNDYHASFDNGVMTTKMEGSNGLRFTTNDGKHLYGMYQVTGKVDKSSGAVTAFYTRSSDDYNNANWGDFSEIDFEFLNGNPSVPSGMWLNSFHKGMSGGERLVKPAEYRTLLGLKEGEDASTNFITYSFNWQPDQVSWYANGVSLLQRRYDEEVSWKDMKGVDFSRTYRPPSYPQHITFSMWSDQDQERAFGGKLEWANSPFESQFKDLRRVLCDKPATSSNGPSWLYQVAPAAPTTPATGGNAGNAATPATPSAPATGSNATPASPATPATGGNPSNAAGSATTPGTAPANARVATPANAKPPAATDAQVVAAALKKPKAQQAAKKQQAGKKQQGAKN
ncbi:MAG: concanavalin A-like lectin/glucanase domain-containing protein [Monoraphidium minutum]|nr:MAG: concanavalin A-like lectin/glucanase domain-containing protein [Monoraphidium minutum]